MDAQESRPGQQLPVASHGTSRHVTKAKVTKEKTKPTKPNKPTKPRRKTAPGVINFSFAVSTPDSFREHLAAREAARQAWNAEHQAPAPTVKSNPLKRVFDPDDDGSTPEHRNKRANTLDAPLEVETSGTDSPGNGVVTKVNQAQRNVGGRPRKHPLTIAKPLLFLRKDKPVLQELCADLWSRIFDFITPEFLLQARQTNTLFRMILEKQSQWKAARMETYGPDHPDPPPGLTEIQYASLLTGIGCQSKRCGERQTRKVYWAFQRRWCPKCIKNNTIKESDTMELEKTYPMLPECLPKVAFDSWGRYCWVGEYSSRPSWAQHSGNHVRYSRLALTDFILEVDEFTATGPNGEKKTDEEKEAWVEEKKEANRVLVERLQEIEAYMEREKQAKSVQAKAIKAERIAFFKARAALMVPPLSAEALDMLPKYRAAIEIPKLPTERSWHELLPKLEADRAKAEERLLANAKITEDTEASERLRVEYKTTEENRVHNTTPAQVFVLALAEKVIGELGALVEAGTVAHVDFVTLVFRKLYEAYDKTHDTGKPGNYEGRPYRLLLDDARMVYNQRIMPFVNNWGNPGKIRAAKELKCPGCKRKDSHRLHSFENLMVHIYETHRSKVGSLSYFDTPLKTLPHNGIAWYRLEWPRNLPILASHHQITGDWDPNDDSEYIHMPRVPPRVLPHGAFEGRCVSNDDDPPRQDFLLNIVHAASLLVEAPFPEKFKTQIVFKYALDKYNKFHLGSDIPTEFMTDLPAALIRAGIRGLFEGFHCLACSMDDRRPRRHNKFVEKNQTLGDLIKHYLAVHEPSQWSGYMLKFSPDKELWDALTKPGAEKAYQIFINLFPETEPGASRTGLGNDVSAGPENPRGPYYR